MRLFIGIGLPSTLAQSLSCAARTLVPANERTRVRWTLPENLHLTLSFLGQVAPDCLGIIEQALTQIHSPSLHLQLDGFGTFPNAGILYANVKPTASLLALAQQVFSAMETCGFPREQRPYTPHITIARTKGRLHVATGENNPAFREKFDARELRIYESVTLPQGAQYKVLHSFPLSEL